MINPLLERFLTTVNLNLLAGRLTIVRRRSYQVFYTNTLREERPLF